MRFEAGYKFKTSPRGSQLIDKREHEYWNLVAGEESNPSIQRVDPKLSTIVEYAADLPTLTYGSGFPRTGSSKTVDDFFVYHDNYFNLNNLCAAPGSLLEVARLRQEEISGITLPWMYLGMQFATFCWHVEDYWLNSLNYNHKGATKTWYIVPAEDKEKFDAHVTEQYGRRDRNGMLLHRITLMFDPLELIRKGIRVYKAHQQERQYICTFQKVWSALL